jgi:hypothetical protein
MKRGMSVLLVCVLSLALVCGAGLFAQVRKDTKTGLDRIEGTVQAINKDKSTITVRQSSKMVWEVTYSATTKFTKMNEPGSLDDVKDGVRVICLGTAAEKGTKMAATRIDVRAPRGPK